MTSPPSPQIVVYIIIEIILVINEMIVEFLKVKLVRAEIINNSDNGNHRMHSNKSDNSKVRIAAIRIIVTVIAVVKVMVLAVVMADVIVRVVLGGPRDLVTTYNWDYNPTYKRGNPYKPIQGTYK